MMHFLMQSRQCWPPLLPGCITDWRAICWRWDMQILSHFLPSQPPACTGVKGYISFVTGLFITLISLYWNSQDSSLPFFPCAKVPLNGSTTTCCSNHSYQFSVFCRFILKPMFARHMLLSCVSLIRAYHLAWALFMQQLYYLCFMLKTSITKTELPDRLTRLIIQAFLVGSDLL